MKKVLYCEETKMGIDIPYKQMAFPAAKKYNKRKGIAWFFWDCWAKKRFFLAWLKNTSFWESSDLNEVALANRNKRNCKFEIMKKKWNYNEMQVLVSNLPQQSN